MLGSLSPLLSSRPSISVCEAACRPTILLMFSEQVLLFCKRPSRHRSQVLFGCSFVVDKILSRVSKEGILGTYKISMFQAPREFLELVAKKGGKMAKVF